MVQMDELATIEQSWVAKGHPYCEHPRMDREYHLGAHTGDAGCLDCGDSWAKGTEATPRGVKPERPNPSA